MTYRTGILKRGKHLWACLKRLIPTFNIFHLHLTRPRSSLIIWKWSRNGRGRLLRHLLPALPLTALLSLILIGDLKTTEDESAPACSRTSSLRKQPFLLVPRWGETTVFAGYGTSMCDFFLYATTYPNWNFPSESLQLQLVNDHLSRRPRPLFFGWRP